MAARRSILFTVAAVTAGAVALAAVTTTTLATLLLVFLLLFFELLLELFNLGNGAAVLLMAVCPPRLLPLPRGLVDPPAL